VELIVTYRKMITLWLAALTTIGSIAAGSLWLFQQVAWKTDIQKTKQELIVMFSIKTDISLLEILRIRYNDVKNDFDIYKNAIRSYETKQSLTLEEINNKQIFEHYKEEAEIEMKSLQRRIQYLEKKVDGVR
jgi:hypothetical protein